MSYREALRRIEAMPRKRLIAGKYWDHGDVCALGACIGATCEIFATPATIAPEAGLTVDRATILVDCNDGGGRRETPEARWERVVAWLRERVAEEERGEVGRG
jgi:hypothetical protein